MKLKARIPLPQQVKEDVQRKGVVLVAVLIVIVLLSLAGYQYSELMLAEYRVAENYHRAVQCRMNAESGVMYAAGLLSDPNFQRNGGNPFNHQGFNGVAIGGELVKGKFSLVAPADPNDASAGFVFGVQDEGGKINLNALMKMDVELKQDGELMKAVLLKLPNMTEEIVMAIMDWMDPDSETRPGGAESDVYQDKGYRCKNGPLDSINELLLIRGIDRTMLYGSDWNRNGTQDASESTSAGFDRGWSAYLTVHSREINSDLDGKPFVYLMNTDITQLQTQLMEALGEEEKGEDLVKFIILYRQYGKPGNTSLGSAIAAALGIQTGQPEVKVKEIDISTYEVDLNKAPKKGDSGKILSLFSLCNMYVVLKSSTDQKTKVKTEERIYSPLNDLETQRNLLPKLFAIATLTDTTKYSEMAPRININTAPAEVLATLPISDVDIEKIVTVRPSLSSGELLSNPIYQTPTWLLTEAQIDPMVLATCVATKYGLDTLITTRTQVFRVQSVGYFDGNKGPAVRVEAIIDTNAGRPRIIAFRNMTDLGKGWDVEMNPQ